MKYLTTTNPIVTFILQQKQKRCDEFFVQFKDGPSPINKLCLVLSLLLICQHNGNYLFLKANFILLLTNTDYNIDDFFCCLKSPASSVSRVLLHSKPIDLLYSIKLHSLAFKLLFSLCAIFKQQWYRLLYIYNTKIKNKK